MNIESITCFLMAARSLNITEAANSLFISPSTASRQISHLEDEFGVKFFRRQTGMLTLTDEGRIFKEHAEKLLQDYESMKIAMQQTRVQDMQELNIAVLNMSYSGPIIQIVHELNQRFPNARIGVTREYRPSVVDEVMTGKLDLLLGFKEALELTDDMVCVPLKSVLFEVVVRADSPLANKHGITASDIAGKKLFMWERARSPRIFDAIVEGCTIDGRKPEVVARPLSRDDILWPVISGEGYSIFSAGVLLDLPDSLVSRPFLDMPRVDNRFCMFYKKDNHNPLLSCAEDSFVRVFREL